MFDSAPLTESKRACNFILMQNKHNYITLNSIVSSHVRKTFADTPWLVCTMEHVKQLDSGFMRNILFEDI